jgi:hypothetical protein
VISKKQKNSFHHVISKKTKKNVFQDVWFLKNKKQLSSCDF